MLNIFFEGVSFPLKKLPLKKAVKDLVVEEGFSLGELTVVFCSDAYLLEMNQNYLEHDYYTDIITFDYCEDKTISGDLFISSDRILENAKINNVDFLNELYRVVFHGTLHLCGYKDKSKGDQKLMRSMEDKYLSRYAF